MAGVTAHQRSTFRRLLYSRLHQAQSDGAITQFEFFRTCCFISRHRSLRLLRLSSGPPPDHSLFNVVTVPLCGPDFWSLLDLFLPVRLVGLTSRTTVVEIGSLYTLRMGVCRRPEGRCR